MKRYVVWIGLTVTWLCGLGGCAPPETPHSFVTTSPCAPTSVPPTVEEEPVTLPTVTPESSPIPVQDEPEVTAILVAPRQIVENTLGLREYWRAPHACTGLGASDHPALVAIADRVACIYYGDNSIAPTLRVYDAANGALLWEAAGLPGDGELAADTERIYFANPGFWIRAYAIGNGQHLWTASFPSRGGYRLEPMGDTLYVYQYGGENLRYVLDAFTGETKNKETRLAADGYQWYTRFPQFDIYERFVEKGHQLSFRAVDVVTQQTLWVTEETGIPPGHRRPLILTDNILLV